MPEHDIATVPNFAVPSYPALPAAAQFDPAQGIGAGAWLDRYVQFASTISPATPRFFHENAALAQTSIIVARRLCVQLPHARIYPNLFSAWIASTTLWNKSTAMIVARQNLRSVAPHLLGPQDTTLEAMLADMAGLEPANLAMMPDEDRSRWEAERSFAAQRGLMVDEMSGLMAAAGRDYNAGLLETYLRLYDCDDFFVRSTRGQGRLTVRNAYLTLISASTPAAMAFHLNSERLWALGWWPRFALLTPDQERPEWRPSTMAVSDADLAGPLIRLYDKLPSTTWPQPPIALNTQLGTGVHQAWQAYDKALRHDLLIPNLPERLWGWYGRAPTQALKVSILLAALDWEAGQAPQIDLPHLVRAISIVESWRASVHRVLALTTQTAYNTLQQRIIHLLASAEPYGATLRDMYKAFRDKTPAEIESVLEQMARVNDILVVDVRPGPQGGRPTKRYRLASS